MKLSQAITLISTTFAQFVAVASSSSSSNITYNVISQVPSNQTVGVIIDGQVYPLTADSKTSTLLHTGEAPSADTYKYALLLKIDNSIIESESFTRNGTDDDSTLNEYYGRSWNSWSLDKMPTILPPLPIIDRIDSDLHIDGEIPTIHFTGNQTAIDYLHANQQSDDIEAYLNMTYISPNDVKTFSNISITVSGHSTRSYAKLSYNVKIPKGDDLYDYRRLKIRSMATDASYMREELAYDIAESVGLPSSRYSYVRLFINDQAIGFFGFAEVMKNPWPKNVFGGGSKKFKGGSLFIADISGRKTQSGGGPTTTTDQQQQSGNQTSSPPTDQMSSGNQTRGGGGDMGNGDGGPSAMSATSDLSYLGNNVTLYSSGQYNLKEDPSTGSANYTRIMDLTKFISEQSNTTTADDSAVSLWQEKMDTDSFLRGLALEIVISNSDAYFTMANNYMLYDDLSNDRIVFSAQDFDLSMGHTMYNVTLMNGGNYTEFPGFSTRPLMTRMLQVPQFKEDFEKLLVNMTKELVNLDILETRIDQIAAMITEDVAWDKACTRVGTSQSMGGGGGGGGGNSIESSDSTTTTTTTTATTGNGGGMSGASDIDFISAVNGPTNSSNNLGIKEWLASRSTNLLAFFDETL